VSLTSPKCSCQTSRRLGIAPRGAGGELLQMLKDTLLPSADGEGRPAELAVDCRGPRARNSILQPYSAPCHGCRSIRYNQKAASKSPLCSKFA
jgi:hypothetical protein